MTQHINDEVQREADLQDRAQCLGCGYRLKGLMEHRCPECGREFDPSRPETMLVIERRYVNRTTRATFGDRMIICAIGLTVFCWACWSRYWPLSGLLFAAAGWLYLSVCWRRRNHPRPDRWVHLPDGRHNWRRATRVLVFLSILSLVRYDNSWGWHVSIGPVGVFYGKGGPFMMDLQFDTKGRIQLSDDWWIVYPTLW